MKVFVPYTVPPPAAVRIALRDRWPTYVQISDYLTYWRDRWSDGASFINVEHDVVVWPGAIESLERCPHGWCAFGYSIHDRFVDHQQTLFPYLGCVKFSDHLIRDQKGLFDHYVGSWETLDKHVGNYLFNAGWSVHQHFPAVVNANPVLLP